MQDRVFAGIRATGRQHIGNYLGAIQNFVALQDKYECIYSIVDLHSLTTLTETEQLRDNVRETAIDLLAAGIRPEETILYAQSHVPEISELHLLLSMVTPIGRLMNVPTFKEKAKSQPENVNYGLVGYPVLQTADIGLYRANKVPVGEDQKQHVELARDIAGRFNHIYGETFVLPEAVIPTAGARVMALDDPTVKMSKSETAGRGHAVRLTDTDDEIRRSLKRAVTDSGREIEFSDDPARAGVNNLLLIYQAITDRSEGQVLADFAGARGYGDLKMGVAEAVIEVVAPIRRRYEELMAAPEELDRLLAIGAERARKVAEPKAAEIRRLVGFA